MQPERGFEPGRPPAHPSRFPIRVDRSWIGAGALLAAHLAFTAYGDRSFTSSITLGIITAAVLFACVVLHALAHLLASRLTKDQPANVRLYVFGDVVDGPRSTLVAVAGPLGSAVTGAVLYVASGEANTATTDVLRSASFASLGLAAINLLPGLPLDGGHLLGAITKRPVLAMRVGQLFGLIAVVGAVYLLASGPSAIDNTAFGLWLLLAGLFILVEARTRTVTVPRVPLDGESAGGWARPFVGRVQADDPVPLSGGPYAVSDGTRLAGVVARGGLTPPGTKCRDVMVAWSSDLGVRSATPLRTALERLARPDAEIVIVVDEKGIVRGVLDEHVVRERMAV